MFVNKNINAMKNIFTKNAGFDHFSKVVKSIGIALFSLIASVGFAQSGTILVNGTGVPVSSSTKFPIWLSAGQTVNISTNVTSISGILYNITPSTAGGNILTMNSVVNITGATTVLANTTLKLEGILFASTAGNTATWNLGGNTAPGSTILGTTDGSSAVNIEAGTGGITIGADAPVKTIGIGTTSDLINLNASNLNQTISGNFTLNGAAASNYSIGAATTSGTITIGGTAQTGGINLGTGTGGQSINIGGTGSTVSVLPFTTAGIVTNTAAGLLGTTPIVPVANGGTGVATLSIGALLVGAGTGPVTTLSGTSNGQVLQWTGSAWAPSSTTSGTMGFWTRTANTLSPATPANIVQINSIAGTNYRPVYADPNGNLKAVTTTPAVFTYTGAAQTYTVPSGVTSITVKLWGAGGGGGYYGGWSAGFSGGGGGFTQGAIAVSAGQTYTVIVGQGGNPGNIVNHSTDYGGGGASCGATGTDCQYAGAGGGRSAFQFSGTELLTAGGGGGGGSNNALGWYSWNYGGAGGGLTGQQGLCTSSAASGGGGGTQSGGGAAGTGANTVGIMGGPLVGGTVSANSYGGGGGGGWYGGGSGGYNASNTMGGGGGGGGYIGGAGVTNGFTVTGNYQYPAQTRDFYYMGGIGLGGITLYPTAQPAYGGNGMVVIIPNF
jgi:hypothetical protein